MVSVQDLKMAGKGRAAFARGSQLLEKGDTLGSIAYLEQAIAEYPSAIGKYYLGWAQYGLSRLTEAEQTLEQALLRNPNLAEAYLLLTRVHMRQKNLPGALKDVETYLKINPRNEQARTLAQEIKREMAQTTTVIATAQP